MPVQNVTPILNVSDVEASVAWFRKVGWREGFLWRDTPNDPVSFGSVCTGADGKGAEIFLCLNGQGSRGTIMPSVPGDDRTDGVWMSWWLESPAAVDALYEDARRLGFITTCEPGDRPWGIREFHLRHPDGHMFRVSAGLGED
jgi:catechol 2,3-dioxygenase-like lactoylglutathione lyase family enzyme